MNDVMGWFFVAVFVALLVFVVLREFWTWYWKQSEQVELLKEIARNLQVLEERGRPLPPDAVPPQNAAAPTPSYATPPWR